MGLLIHWDSAHIHSYSHPPTPLSGQARRSIHLLGHSTENGYNIASRLSAHQPPGLGIAAGCVLAGRLLPAMT